MTPQQYLENVLEKYNLTEGQVANLKAERQYVEDILKSYFGSSIETNIPKHKEYVSKHQARPIIKLMKVWRHRHGIHFRSFALELLVIKALADPSSGDFGTQLWKALEFGRDHAPEARLVDPANTN